MALPIHSIDASGPRESVCSIPLRLEKIRNNPSDIMTRDLKPNRFQVFFFCENFPPLRTSGSHFTHQKIKNCRFSLASRISCLASRIPFLASCFLPLVSRISFLPSKINFLTSLQFQALMHYFAALQETDL